MTILDVSQRIRGSTTGDAMEPVLVFHHHVAMALALIPTTLTVMANVFQGSSGGNVTDNVSKTLNSARQDQSLLVPREWFLVELRFVCMLMMFLHNQTMLPTTLVDLNVFQIMRSVVRRVAEKVTYTVVGNAMIIKETHFGPVVTDASPSKSPAMNPAHLALKVTSLVERSA